MTRALALGACLVLCLPLAPCQTASADSQLHARVIVDTTLLRSGPGVGFRRVHVAHRDDMFPIVARASSGYWFRVELPDGTHGWVLGDTVYNHEISDEEADSGRFMPGLFAPPPMPGADGEVAIMFGALGGGGMIALRPSLLLEPTLGLEFNGGVAVASGGRLLFATGGPVINLVPDSVVMPFLTVQAGITASSPNADTFLLKTGSIGTLVAGGGLRLGFKYRITLRLEARAWVLHEADQYVAKEEFSAGLTVFF